MHAKLSHTSLLWSNPDYTEWATVQRREVVMIYVCMWVREFVWKCLIKFWRIFRCMISIEANYTRNLFFINLRVLYNNKSLRVTTWKLYPIYAIRSYLLRIDKAGRNCYKGNWRKLSIIDSSGWIWVFVSHVGHWLFTKESHQKNLKYSNFVWN